MIKPKVIIFGAGISGLTIANELINKNFAVEIYEKSEIPGGMARSFRYKNNNVPTEHSWRGYGPFYYNTFDIMGKIPINEQPIVLQKKVNKEEKKQNEKYYSLEEVSRHNTPQDAWVTYNEKVYDITKFIRKHPGGNLILNSLGKDLNIILKQFNVDWHINNTAFKWQLNKYMIGYLEDNTKSIIIPKTVNSNLVPVEFLLLKNVNTHKKEINISIFDYPYLFYTFIKPILSNKRQSYYFKQKLSKYLNTSFISNDSKQYLIDFVLGPGYGFDKNNISIQHFATFLTYQTLTGNRTWQTMNQPTNEAWIDYWIVELKKKGVVFNYNNSLKRLDKTGDKINYCITNRNDRLYADEYIIAINPNNLEEIFHNSGDDFKDLEIQHSNLKTINNQISFRLGFNKKIIFPKTNLGFVLLDSPYNITFYAQEDSWLNSVELGLNGNIKTLISGTIIQSNIKGSVYKDKSASDLDKSELLEEIIYQFFESKDFIDIAYTSQVNNTNIIYTEIFDDWFFDNQNQKLKSKNLKWVNTYTNEEYRPNNKITNIDNLYLAGAHTNTSTLIWSMESAIESGKKTSNLILKKYNKGNCILFTHHLPLTSIAKMDDILYNYNLPHLIDCLIILIILIILSYLVI